MASPSLYERAARAADAAAQLWAAAAASGLRALADRPRNGQGGCHRSRSPHRQAQHRPQGRGGERRMAARDDSGRRAAPKARGARVRGPDGSQVREPPRPTAAEGQP
eukprot:8961831-Lingulodinium_polyedra.AAC.1